MAKYGPVREGHAIEPIHEIQEVCGVTDGGDDNDERNMKQMENEYKANEEKNDDGFVDIAGDEQK